MPNHSDYISALKTYSHAIDDVSHRTMQDRQLHMHNLNEVYMQALAGGEHDGYVSMLEQAIGERSVYNDRKMIMDAADLTMHENKVTQALSHNRGALSGGGVVDRSSSALRGMNYAAKRSNALHASFNQKLTHDRALHQQELEALYSATPSNTACKSVLGNMIKRRVANNESRTYHDANKWAGTDAKVLSALGGGSEAIQVLAHGVGGTSAPQMRGGEDVVMPLENPEAAKLWGDILGQSNGITGGSFY
jgi:hypothetical protein